MSLVIDIDPSYIGGWEFMTREERAAAIYRARSKGYEPAGGFSLDQFESPNFYPTQGVIDQRPLEVVDVPAPDFIQRLTNGAEQAKNWIEGIGVLPGGSFKNPWAWIGIGFLLILIAGGAAAASRSRRD